MRKKDFAKLRLIAVSVRLTFVKFSLSPRNEIGGQVNTKVRSYPISPMERLINSPYL